MENKQIINKETSQKSSTDLYNMGHEKILICQDEKSGLKAIVAIHSTICGPALGGTRMWNYVSSEEALTDVMRLSRGMTYKNAISGLNLGGGKAVIIGDSATQKSPELFRAFGTFIESLNGSYITAEDVGISPEDMIYVSERTKHVTGLPGKKGDPSPVTAYGVYMGMKASAKFKWGSDSLEGRTILVQGVGHVGETLVKYTNEEGAKVYVTDINDLKLDEVAEKYGTEIIKGDSIYDMDMDIYAPCALGATVNDSTIHQLKAKVIAGAANNQLADELKHGLMLREKGIVYAPDFLINAGGIINVYAELENYGKQEIIRKTENIFNTTLEILNNAETNGITTHQAAFDVAQARIDSRKKEK